MIAFNLILALLALAALAAVAGIGLLAGAGHVKQRSAAVEELSHSREQELEAA